MRHTAAAGAGDLKPSPGLLGVEGVPKGHSIRVRGRGGKKRLPIEAQSTGVSIGKPAELPTKTMATNDDNGVRAQDFSIFLSARVCVCAHVFFVSFLLDSDNLCISERATSGGPLTSTHLYIPRVPIG